MSIYSRHRTVNPMFALLGLAVIGSLVGCNDSGYSLTDQNTSAIEGVKNQLVDTQSAIDNTTTAISDLTKPNPTTDVRQLFDTYVAQTDALNASTVPFDAAVAKLRVVSDARMVSWDKDIAAITDPAAQAKAKERRSSAAFKVNALFVTLRNFRDAEKAYIVSLNNFKSQLNHDLTPAGIANAAEPAKSIYNNARSLRKSINEAIAEVDDISGQVSTGGAATPAAK